MKQKDVIQLSDSFSYKRLIRFVIPSVVMMIFTSIYSVVDGLFVANFASETEFAAINFIMPLLIILGAIGFMIGTGGTAIVAKTLGMGEKEHANECFSLLIYATAIIGVVLSVLGILLAKVAASLLGAEGEMLRCCTLYARIVLSALPFFMLQNVFQSFFITAEKPKLGLCVTVAAGVTNMVLDALFVAVFKWGLVGAAMATAISQLIGGSIPFIYFSRKNTSLLRLGKTRLYFKTLRDTCINGSSELMSNISMSVVTIFYNAQLMHFEGQAGVAAYGAISYVSFFFVSVFIGFVIGSSPIVSYHYGAGNKAELKNLRKKSMNIIAVAGIAMTLLSLALTVPLCTLFVGNYPRLYELTVHGYIIFSFSYLMAGFNIFGSAFFTALNNGVISAVISFVRTLLFQCVTVSVLPIFFKLDGVWFSIIVAEVLSLALTSTFLITKRKKYGY